MLRVRAADVLPPGPAVKTAMLAEPAVLIKLAGTVANRLPAAFTAVRSGLPFYRTTEPG